MKKGSKHTLETKRKMKKSRPDQSVKNNPMYGKTHTKEAKEKNRLSNTGSKNHQYKGETYQLLNGRWRIWINGIRYMRARYVATKCLGRELEEGETVHHINEDPSDDKPENLYSFATAGEHNSYHRMKNSPILIFNIKHYARN